MTSTPAATRTCGAVLTDWRGCDIAVPDESVFLFCGRKRDRIKAMYWEGDGFLLLYKRLESGSFQWPRSKNEVQALTPQQYRWLMEGLKTEQLKANRTVSGLSMI